MALAYDVAATARRFRPDVVYAHFLVPAGLLAILAGRAPAVLTAHGQDVANAERSGIVRAATRLAVRRAAGVVAVSDWLRARLEAVVPEARGRVEVIDCGVDLRRFAPSPVSEARTTVDWQPAGTGFVCVGGLTERKNVLRLARAFERRGEGDLAFVGDGPLRDALAGRPGVTTVGAVSHDAVADWLGAADVVCQPSLVEPFGLSTLEAMACGRSVVATRVGGPPEFVPSDAGVLVDPEDEDALVDALGGGGQASPAERRGTRGRRAARRPCAGRADRRPAGARGPRRRGGRRHALVRVGRRLRGLRLPLRLVPARRAAPRRLEIVAQVRVALDDHSVHDPPEPPRRASGRSGRSSSR